MGADYKEQDKGIEILRAMPSEAREYIAHHLRNSLAAIIGNIYLAMRETDKPSVHKQLSVATECVEHAVADLKRINC